MTSTSTNLGINNPEFLQSIISKMLEGLSAGVIQGYKIIWQAILTFIQSPSRFYHEVGGTEK